MPGIGMGCSQQMICKKTCGEQVWLAPPAPRQLQFPEVKVISVNLYGLKWQARGIYAVSTSEPNGVPVYSDASNRSYEEAV